MTKAKPIINIIGGGLSGAECAIKLLEFGFGVKLYEMRPKVNTGAHNTELLAELVCSNSLKSEGTSTASGLLKAELDALDCNLLEIARQARVPAGSALSVDREIFSKKVEEKLSSFEKFELIREEITDIDDDSITVIATGPLTSAKMAEKISNLTGSDRLFFYDAIAPIVDFSSVDMKKAYFGGRYSKGGDDYLNLPMTKEEYNIFYYELINANSVILHEFEKKELFAGCMPIEEMAKRGSDTIRFGPLKPVGLSHPETGEKAYAVVQLRKENVAGDCFNLVGFQTNLTYSEQKRVFRLIPALENVEFLRYGVMHRNTYINSPLVSASDFSLKNSKNIYFCGQLSGVEGYMESIMSGLMVAYSIICRMNDKQIILPAETTITGSLLRYILYCPNDFQPMNSNFGLLPSIVMRDKKARKIAYFERGLEDIKSFKISLDELLG